MDKVIVVFGSYSDNESFYRISDALKDGNIPHDVRVCSAHRTPAQLVKILDEKHSCVVAGAGLAAHLPGVVASKTVKLTIGVPVNNNYEGLDALLSIHQMPPGIPVLGMGMTENYFELQKLFKPYDRIVLAIQKTPQTEKAVQKAKDTLAKFKIKTEILRDGSSPQKKDIVINFTELDSYRTIETENLSINVPCKKENKAFDSLKILALSKSGFWVGLNRGENAVLAAMQVLSIKGKGMDKQMSAYRKNMASKVMEDDKLARKGRTKKLSIPKPNVFKEVPKTLPKKSKKTPKARKAKAKPAKKSKKKAAKKGTTSKTKSRQKKR